MLQSRRIYIVNPKICPIEHRLDRFQGGRRVHLMHLRHIEQGLRAVDLLEVSNDF